MAQVTLKGNPFNTVGALPAVGAAAHAGDPTALAILEADVLLTRLLAREPVVLGEPALREARKLVERAGVGTKAQQAMSISYEARKIESRALAREARQAQAERRFALRRQKRKQKHRGR